MKLIPVHPRPRSAHASRPMNKQAMAITVCISDELFSFFPTLLDPNEFRSPQDICTFVRRRLVETLHVVRLDALAERAAALRLHTHGAETIQELIAQAGDSRKVYLCSDPH